MGVLYSFSVNQDTLLFNHHIGCQKKYCTGCNFLSICISNFFGLDLISSNVEYCTRKPRPVRIFVSTLEDIKSEMNVDLMEDTTEGRSCACAILCWG